MLKTIGKWALKKAAAVVARQVVKIGGGGPAAQDIAGIVAETTVEQALEN